MEYKEFLILAKGMKAIWAKDDFLRDKDATDIWYALLKDLPYEAANAAVQIHMRTSKWPPTPAEIIDHVTKAQVKIGDWSEGWEQVIKAIGRFGYTDEAGALASMDETTRTAVKRLGWKQICQSDQDELMSIRANFRQIYGQVKTDRETQARIPAVLSEVLEDSLAGAKQIGGIG